MDIHVYHIPVKTTNERLSYDCTYEGQISCVV